MSKLATLIVFAAGSILVMFAASFGQTQKDDQREVEKANREVAYYAPIRYVIVYNDIVELAVPQRRIVILMEPAQFNRKNLIRVFDLIKKRFPTPVSLTVDVHTSLATIETPEEQEMLKDGEDTRFRKLYFKFRRAWFSHDTDSRDNFCYTISLNPYRDRWAFPVRPGEPLSPC